MNRFFPIQFLLFIATICCTAGYSQLVNGSFETADSIATFSGWTFSCSDGDSIAHTPTNGGKWSLRKTSGNTQSCFPGYVYQTIPQADSGQIWQLDGWARMDSFSQPFNPIGIYLAKIDSQGTFHLLKGDTTHNTSWTFLSLRDTLDLQTGDTLIALLDPGMTAGPALGLAYFDNLSLDSIGLSTRIFQRKQLTHISLEIRPHPLDREGWLNMQVDQATWLNLELFDLQGNRVRVLAQGTYPSGTHAFRLNVGDLPPSLYLLYLHTPEGILSQKLLVRH